MVDRDRKDVWWATSNLCPNSATPECHPCNTSHDPRPTRMSFISKREQVIASIEAGTNTFYVLDKKTGKRSDVGVVRPAGERRTCATQAFVA